MKKYFYQDKHGKIQKYIYCIRGCPEPYEQTQKGTGVFKVTEKVFVCHKCIKTLSIDNKMTRFDNEFDITERPPVKKNKNLIESIIARKNEEDAKEKQDLEESFKAKDNTDFVQTEKEPEKIEKKELCQRFFAIVLKCRDNTFYCGITSDIEKALKNHNSGNNGNYTKPKERRPVTLVESIEVSSQKEAKEVKIELQKKYC